MHTWEDIERAAMNEAGLYRLVTLVHVGALTREQALIEAVLYLGDIADIYRRQVDLMLKTLPARAMVLSGPAGGG